MQSWERRDTESDSQYAAFRLYLSFPPPRPSLPEVARRVGKSTITIRRYSADHKWAARTRDWDNRLANIHAGVAAEIAVEDADKITREHLAAIRTMRELGHLVLAQSLDIARKTGRAEDVPPRVAGALIRDAVTLERLVLGDATERTETRAQDLDLTRLTGEEAEQLLALLEKVNGPRGA
jgi:hypothetical protein